MSDHSATVQCPVCGEKYHVELRKLRPNMRIACPRCAYDRRVSESEALKAHRLLDQLEYEQQKRRMQAA